MIYEIDLLSNEQLKYINDIFDVSDFTSGQISNSIEPELKNNEEMIGFERNKLTEYIVESLNNSRDFIEITSSKSYAGILFSKYEKDMYYHLHNDDYSMGAGTRTDFSSTIFLNSPNEYEGGELILTLGNQELSYKLEAGKCIIYPTGLLHRVAPIKSGTRKVCVFWTESCINDTDIRMILADFHFMWSKYYEEMYEKLGHEYCVNIQNIKMRLMRKYGNFSGLTIK
jgi:PKHD-type hydroxylase